MLSTVSYVTVFFLIIKCHLLKNDEVVIFTNEYKKPKDEPMFSHTEQWLKISLIFKPLY